VENGRESRCKAGAEVDQASPGNLGLVELARLERVDLHMQMQMEEDEGYGGQKG
jgi:hypothetical protein